jgi:RecB family exonuclease
VAKRMAELQMEICNEAIKTGYVDDTKRDKLLKYQQHYEYFK